MQIRVTAIIFFALANCFGLHQLVTTPTRGNAVLGLFFVKNPDQVSAINVLDFISDHATIHVETTFTFENRANNRRTIFNYARANMEVMNISLNVFLEEFLAQYHDRSVEENWTLFKHEIWNLVSTNIPKINVASNHLSPWFTSSLRRMLNKKKRLFQKAKRTNRDDD